MSTLFIGHTRFSVHQYESGSFVATRKEGGFSRDEYTAWLYDDERLSTRTAIFLEESLPQLAEAAQGNELLHIVAISPSLPEKYKSALEQARAQYKFLRIHETKMRAAPSQPNLRLVKKMLTKRGMEGKVFGMYRVDDDDLLPIDYFERMGPYVTDEHVGYRVSLPRGIGAVRAQDGYILPWSFYEAKSSAGFLTVHRFSPDGQKIYGLEARHHLKGHHKADRNFPVILDARAPGFFRARHRTQDSTLSSSSGPFFTRVTDQALGKPSVSLDEIKKAFPCAASRIFASASELAASANLLAVPATIDTNPLTFSYEFKRPYLLSGEMETESPVRLSVTCPEATPGSAEATFLKEAGFAQTQGTFSKNIHLDEGRLTAVIEPPENGTITSFQLSSAQPATLKNLAAAPLNSKDDAV
ncbi:glycosyltransferase [Nesterenkonia populi]